MGRKERRKALRELGITKHKNQLNFLNPKRVELRKKNRESGEKRHRDKLDSVDDLKYERLEHKQAEYEKKLKADGFNDKEIEMLVEAFILDNVKDKESYQKDKNKSKALKRKANNMKSSRVK